MDVLYESGVDSEAERLEEPYRCVLSPLSRFLFLLRPFYTRMHLLRPLCCLLLSFLRNGTDERSFQMWLDSTSSI